MEFVLPIMGFTQSMWSVTGIERGWKQLRRGASAQRVVMTPVQWNCDVTAMAQFLARNGCEKLYIIAYSWGAATAMNLLKELARIGAGRAVNAGEDRGSPLGIRVPVAWLFDPVVRDMGSMAAVRSWFSTKLGIGSLPNLVVPNDVEVGMVHHVYQRTDWPRGCPVVAEDERKGAGAPLITGWFVIGTGHSAMDEDETMWRSIYTELRIE